MATDPDSTVRFDYSPFGRLYESGRFERVLGTDVVTAGEDSITAVLSKDIIIDPLTGLAARLFIPSEHLRSPVKLPILVYYHGGGFVIETPYSPTYHTYLNSLVSKAKVLAVSVHYRRAPEDPLPAAYDDSWAALRWVAAAGDEWLSEHGDLRRLFLAGDSAGANIVHHMALRAAAAGRSPEIEGTILIHPFFVGGAGAASPEVTAWMERFWALICPTSAAGLEDAWINVLTEAAPPLEKVGCRKVMVAVAELDELSERGKAYFESLKGGGFDGEVEFLESKGENHVFHLIKPGSDNAEEMMEKVIAFLHR